MSYSYIGNLGKHSTPVNMTRQQLTQRHRELVAASGERGQQGERRKEAQAAT